jgi:hypothetical protein
VDAKAGNARRVQINRSSSIADVASSRETVGVVDDANIGAYSKHGVAYTFTGEGRTTGACG